MDDPAKNVENVGGRGPRMSARARSRVDPSHTRGDGDPGRDAPRQGLAPRRPSDHARPVENRRALSTRRDVFLDERGAGLRVSWHPERDLVVLSVWQDDSCVGTFRMTVQDVPRLNGLLAAVLGDWVDHIGGESHPAWGHTGAKLDTNPATEPGGGLGANPGANLSVQQRLRLSRPVLRLRGLQHRRRRPD
jgi:hypothetical protein